MFAYFSPTRGGALLLALVALAAAAAWAGPLSELVSPGDLARPHIESEGVARCTDCHELGAAAGVSANRCMDCHERVQEEVERKEGFHGEAGQDCASCHPDHLGREFDLLQLDEASFQHQLTGFALSGAHATLRCRQCHVDKGRRGAGMFAGLEADCASCHEQDHGVERSERALLGQCRACHSAGPSWSMREVPADVFDHRDERFVDHPLVGEHVDQPCAACHRDHVFVPTAHEACSDCHEDRHAGQFEQTVCDACHDPAAESFVPEAFDHDRTDFPLLGLHGRVDCAACHEPDPVVLHRGLPHGQCGDCHQDHHDDQFGDKRCEACHDHEHEKFAVPDFDHDKTDYPLEGAHKPVECEKCHEKQGEVVRHKPIAHADCDDCHVHADPHEGRFEPETCDSCHKSLDSWKNEAFDHDKTAYPLTGAHEPVECLKCHISDDRPPIEYASCLDCHHATANPHGEELGPESCEDCHVTSSWLELTWDHAAGTTFPLVDAHAELACSLCHEDRSYTGEQADCAACHDDEAPARHFEGACDGCHDQRAWLPASFGALGHDVTGFALRGLHRELRCSDCHQPAEHYAAAQPDCADCHASDDPHHHLLGDRCQDCHDEQTWHRSRWRHSAVGWALRGSHRLLSCDGCHATGFIGTPRDCVRCHEYEAPDTRPHQTAFSEDCAMCHGQGIWDDVRYPHGDFQ